MAAWLPARSWVCSQCGKAATVPEGSFPLPCVHHNKKGKDDGR